ncbi:MAG: glycosyltransferase [Caldisericia bacterium]
MIRYLITQQLNIVIFFTLVLINSFFNIKRIKNLKNVETINENLPKISILIPARNEEKNIEKCVKSILNQNYPDFEIIILNDNSTDSTPQILDKLKENYPKLIVINNISLENGWLGKANACQKLYEESKGEILVFIDADTFHKENSMLKAISFFVKTKSDLITIFPQEIVDSFFEKLIIPFMNFALMSFYPLIPFANGQFMIYRREVLDKFNGFQKIKEEVLDDIKMANLLRINKYKVNVLSGKDISFCKMYYDTKSLFYGFIKSYFAIFDYHLLLSIFVFTYLVFSFFYPFIMLGLKFSLNLKEINLITNLIILIFSYTIFLITYIKFNYPFYMTFLFHLTILLNSIIGYLSIIYTITGKRVWKDRKLPKKKIKLI